MGRELVSGNSFSRIYGTGSELKPHRDKNTHEIGVSICLSRGETDWPFCIESREGQIRKTVQNPGDAIIFDDKLLHWREGPFQGNEQSQVFLHYADAHGPNANAASAVERAILYGQSPSLKDSVLRFARQPGRPLRKLRV